MNDLLAILAIQLQKPWVWTQLVLTLVCAIAIHHFGRLMLNYIERYLSNDFIRVTRLVWLLTALIGWLAVATKIVNLTDVPVMYEFGTFIMESSRNVLGQVVVNLAIALILWNLVGSVSGHIVPENDQFTRSSVRKNTLRGVIDSTLKVLIVIGSLITILQTLGVNATSLLAGVSVLGIAVGFGAQSLVKDVFTGFFILLEDQYGVGDVITINNTQMTGTVEKLNLRLTVIRALDGIVHIVPNGQITTVSVSSKDWSRVVAIANISYKANVDEGLAVLTQVCHEIYKDPKWGQYFLEEPEIQGVTELGSDSVTLRALFKVVPKSQWSIEREFNLRVKKALDDAGIDIPFPQRTISFEGVPIELKVSPEQLDAAAKSGLQASAQTKESKDSMRKDGLDSKRD